MRSRAKLAILGAIFFSCSSVAAAQEAPSRSIVRLSYIPGNFALPMLVGIEHGLFAHEGLFLSTVPITDEGAIMRSLGAGATDFAIGSQTLLLSMGQNKLDAKVVAIAGHGREIELVVPIWDTATKSFADIKGKGVLALSGVHNFDAVPELYRAMALSKPPMRLSDVNVQFFELANLQRVLDPSFRQNYAQRKIAGILMFREFTAQYVDQKKARVVLSHEDLTKLIGRTGAQPLFASKRIIDKEPKTVERFVRAWARTMEHISNPANKEAVVRLMQIYYMRQYGFPLKKEFAELYVSATKYDRVAWTEQDSVEAGINGKALGAARNLLFARIKDPNQRPFKDIPEVKDFVDSSFAAKALADLAAEKKAAAEKKPDEKPAAPPPKVGDDPTAAPPKDDKPGAAPSAPPKN